MPWARSCGQLLGIAASVLGVAACDAGGGGADAGSFRAGACGDIYLACHVVDTGTGPVSDCHDLAHDGDQSLCEPRRDECVELCEAVQADAAPGVPDGGG